MRSILVISIITFALIFGVIVVLSGAIPKPAPVAPAAPAAAADIGASERAFADLALERDRAQRDKEGLLSLRTQQAAEAKMLGDQENHLKAMLDSLRGASADAAAARGKAFEKLAKMYEAMKPEKAAPILAALEMDVVLDIMRRMKDRPAARILASMDSGLAAQISARLSQKGLG